MGDEFDPQVDFAQFLKEAKTHASHYQENSEAASPHASEDAEKKKLSGREKLQKSWKDALFSWLKGDKKSTNIIIAEEQGPPSKTSYSKFKGCVSGPINGDPMLQLWQDQTTGFWTPIRENGE